MTLQEKVLFQHQLSEFFRPGAPINKKDLFSGRQKQIKDVIDATFQAGQHVIIFGERGVGKTSLATTLSELLEFSGVSHLSTGAINCDGTDDFNSLWRKVFRELHVVVKTPRPGFGQGYDNSVVDFDGSLPDRITPDDVRIAINQAIQMTPDCSSMIIILDEVDRIKKKTVTSLLCDTIKSLSDRLTPVTIVLVGVADTIDNLISEHKSIERSIVQVAMPRMSRVELSELVNNGFIRSGMTITENASDHIVRLSQGLPHFAHLLSLESGKASLAEDRIGVSLSDVFTATAAAVSRCHSHLSSYLKATQSAQPSNLYPQVLLACVLAKRDELGWFSSKDISVPLSHILRKNVTATQFSRQLKELCGEPRGSILQQSIEQRNRRFRFTNPLLEPFVTIKSLSNEILTSAELLNFVTTN